MIDSKPALKIEIYSLGFGKGAAIREQAYLGLVSELTKFFKNLKKPMLLDGLILKTVIISLCAQYDDIHCIAKEQVLVPAGKD